MSDVRTIDAIQKEYGELCAHAGHIQLQIDILKSDLKRLNDRRKMLNTEAAELSKPKAEVKSNE